MKRLFIASKIEFDNELANVLNEIKESLTEETIRWVEPSNLHLTFHFLGNTIEDKIPILIELLADTAKKSNSFEIEIESFGVFKNYTNSNSIWFGFMRNENLNTLKYLLDRNLEKLNYPLKNQSFKPHLTIGRFE
jgi:2'-5' RNA ligase